MADNAVTESLNPRPSGFRLIGALIGVLTILVAFVFLGFHSGCSRGHGIQDNSDSGIQDPVLDAAPVDAATGDAAFDAAPDGGPGGDQWGYGIDCEPAAEPSLPADSPRILIIGPGEYLDGIATYLRGMLEADPEFVHPEVVALASEAQIDTFNGGDSLMNFFYLPDGRDERLAPLDEPWSYVVLLESNQKVYFPELHFEGVRVLGCRARASGAKPIVLMNTFYLGEGGEPCQNALTAHQVTYRVANGTNSVVAPAGYAWDALGWIGPEAGWGFNDRFCSAATLYSTLTDRNASDTCYAPDGIDPAQALQIANVALETVRVEAGKVHYQDPYEGVIQMRSLPPGGELWFMDSGSSSEQIWHDRMNEILPKVGLTPRGTRIGYTNPSKTFDEEALALAVPYFREQQYQILFARSYYTDGNNGLEADMIRTAGAQTGLQVQLWDRHYDSDTSDGVATLQRMEYALESWYRLADILGLELIPYHLMFAKLKTMRPTIPLLSDGVHATYAVGYGLAVMSVVSRTGLHVPTTGLDPDTELASQLAEETIRQLSSLSVTGKFVPDDPGTRPKIP